MVAQPARPPSKVIADILDVREDLVAVIERDGLRLGTAADAGRECVTSRSPAGISNEMYRFYMRTQGAPKPYRVRDPITRKMVAARDDEGRELFDLDAVAAWNRDRPGSGARAGRPLKWTQMRHDLITDARDGQVRRSAQTGRPFHMAKELSPREVQRLRELIDAELLALPRGDGGGRYRLTRAGEQWLAEHQHRLPCTTG